MRRPRRVHVQVVDEIRARDLVRIRERVDQRVTRVLHSFDEEGVELDPVAGRQHGVLEDLGAALGAEPQRAEALAQLDRSRAVAEPEADEALHEDRELYSRSPEQKTANAASNTGGSPVSSASSAP